MGVEITEGAIEENLIQQGLGSYEGERDGVKREISRLVAPAEHVNATTINELNIVQGAVHVYIGRTLQLATTNTQYCGMCRED